MPADMAKLAELLPQLQSLVVELKMALGEEAAAPEAEEEAAPISEEVPASAESIMKGKMAKETGGYVK